MPPLRRKKINLLLLFFCFPSVWCASVCVDGNFRFVNLTSVCFPSATLLPFYLFSLKKERSSNIFIKFSFFFYAFSYFFNIILLLFYTFSYFFLFLREFFRFYTIIHNVKKYVQYVYMYLRIYVYT